MTDEQNTSEETEQDATDAYAHYLLTGRKPDHTSDEDPDNTAARKILLGR